MIGEGRQVVNVAEKEDVRFREVQSPLPRFRKWLSWGLLGIVAFNVGLMALIRLWYHRAFGGTSGVDVSMPLRTAFDTVIVPLVGIALVLVVRAETEVRDDGLYVLSDWPFKFLRTKVALEGAVSVEARLYRRGDYYLGRGRRRGKGKGYLLYGDRCARIDYSDGRHVVIGSQRAEELAEAIRGLIKEKGDG